MTTNIVNLDAYERDELKAEGWEFDGVYSEWEHLYTKGKSTKPTFLVGSRKSAAQNRSVAFELWVKPREQRQESQRGNS